MPLMSSGRSVEAVVSFLKTSKFSWMSYVKTYQHSYSWNLRKFSFVFIYFINMGFMSFLEGCFFIGKNEKVISRQY